MIVFAYIFNAYIAIVLMFSKFSFAFSEIESPVVLTGKNLNFS